MPVTKFGFYVRDVVDETLVTQYHTYGCPKCGAKHKFGHLAGYRDCYVCWYNFDPATHSTCKPLRLYIGDEAEYTLAKDFETFYRSIKIQCEKWYSISKVRKIKRR